MHARVCFIALCAALCLFAPAVSTSAPPPPADPPFLTMGPYSIVGSSPSTWSERVILGSHNETCGRPMKVEFQWTATSANSHFALELDWVEIGVFWPETGYSAWYSASNVSGHLSQFGVLRWVTSTADGAYSDSTGPSCITQIRLRGQPNFTAPQVGRFNVRFSSI
jgi:hypothetical protein